MTSGNLFPSNWWDPSRFVRTLSYFGAIPFLSDWEWFQAMLGSRVNPTVNGAEWSRSGGRILLLGQGGDGRDRIQQALQKKGYRVEVQASEAPANESPGTENPLQGVVICSDAENLLDLGTQLNALRPRLQATAPSLFDYTCPNADLQEIWGALDDVVMGGISESSLYFVEGAALFAGNVSTANSGGFASVRTRNFEPPLNLSGSDGLELQVQGDGNRYKVLLRSESAWDGVAYSYSFDTVAGEWIIVRVPFSELTPVFRAKTVQVPPIDASRVYALQVMLSKFEYDGALNPHFTAGPFKLKIASIGVYRNSGCPQLILLSKGDAPQNGDRSYPTEISVRESGLPYTIIRYPQMIDAPGGQSLTIKPDGWLAGGITTTDLAETVAQVMEHSQATNTTFAIASGTGICPPGDWECLLGRLRPQVKS